jgi:hypothetical protein
MQSSIRVLIVRAHLLEMIISIAFIGLGLFMWPPMHRTSSDVSLSAGATLLVAGAMVFLFATKSILKYTRRCQLTRCENSVSKPEDRSGLLGTASFSYCSCGPAGNHLFWIVPVAFEVGGQTRRKPSTNPATRSVRAVHQFKTLILCRRLTVRAIQAQAALRKIGLGWPKRVM